MVLQRKDYSFFLCGDVMILVKVVDDEGEGRRIGQHVRYRGPTCANKGQTQVEC
jgi:hypothetical protein